MPSGLFLAIHFSQSCTEVKYTKTLQVIWSVVKRHKCNLQYKIPLQFICQCLQSHKYYPWKTLYRRDIYEHSHLGCKKLKGKMSMRIKLADEYLWVEPEISNYTLHKFYDNVILINIWPDKITFLCTYVTTKGLN